MAEYIERDALRDDIRESYLKLQEIYETLRYERERDICRGELGTFCEILMRIKDFPAADVVEVVRCGECEKRSKSADLTFTVYCPWIGQQMDKKDFCSYGERRAE